MSAILLTVKKPPGGSITIGTAILAVSVSFVPVKSVPVTSTVLFTKPLPSITPVVSTP